VAHDHSSPASTGPLDDFRALLADAPEPNADACDQLIASFDHGGTVADLAGWVAAWRGSAVIRRPIVALYASALLGEVDGPVVARQRLEHLAQGGGAVNQFARAQGAGVEVFDLAIDQPAQDAADRSVCSPREVAATIAFGMEALAKKPDLLVLGDLTVGSDRLAAALIAVLCGSSAELVALDADLDWTEAAIDRARINPPEDVIGWMARLGGREVAAMVGAILAARVQGVPVLLDGLAAVAAALCALHIDPRAIEHVKIAASPDHPAMGPALFELDQAPVIGLASGSGEGCDGLAVLALLRLAVQD
jgi:nicotinate-nucleotide--dimethylbenzimidazole phosphoribosyltransferase